MTYLKKTIIIVLFFICPLVSKASISVEFLNSNKTGDTFRVSVLVFSTYTIDTVTATVGNRTIPLTYDNITGFNNGTISLVGLPQGPLVLYIYVKDVLGNTQTTPFNFTYNSPPTINMISPLNMASFQSKVHVKATVSDVGSANCKGTIYLNNNGNNSRVIGNFINSIDTTIEALPPGFIAGTATISVVATDSTGLASQQSASVTIDKSSDLSHVYTDTGKIIDFKDNRVLMAYTDANGIIHYKISNITTHTSVPIPLNTITTETNVVTAALCTGGAVFNINYDIYPQTQNYNIYIWSNNKLTNISQPLGILATEYSSNTQVSGNYLMWQTNSNSNGIALTDLTTLTTTYIPVNVYYNNNSLKDGNIAYSMGADIYKYNISTKVTTQITTTKNNINPSIDNNNIAYIKYVNGATGPFSIYLNNGTTDENLGTVNQTDTKSYLLNDGYVLFTKAGPQYSVQVWLRKPNDSLRQLSFFSNPSNIDILGDKGKAIFDNNSSTDAYSSGYRYYSDSLTSFKQISGSYGNTYYVNNNFYLAIGGSLYKYNISSGTVPPQITSISPTSAGQGTTVTIKGKNFKNLYTVFFDNVPATSFTAVSDSVITATVGTGASGTIHVTTSDGTADFAGFTFISPPTITHVTPLSAAVGDTVTITGTNLTGASAVSFGGAPAASFTVNSATTIKAIVAAGSSNGNVSVTTPGGSFNFGGFVFMPPPTITSVSPLTAATGTTVTITGTNFTRVSTVYLGARAESYTVNSTTSISAIVGTGSTSGNVTVNTVNGTATFPGFTFIPPPTITVISPTTAGAGTSVTITGTNLTDASAVTFGNVPAASFIVNSATSITAIVGTGGTTGYVYVTTTPGGLAAKAGFVFIPPPYIDSVNPSSATAGTTVYIYGNNLSGATAVSFGGVPATSFKVLATTEMTAVVGNGASGDLVITTPGGSVTYPNFIFTPAPIITSISPTTAIAGTPVTITGTDLTTTSAVSFGGTPAASFKVISPTSITAIVGSGTSGDVSLTTIAGTATMAGFSYVFTLPANNFKLTTNSATCRGSNNGLITITAAQKLNYTATITGNGLNAAYPFTTSTNIANLAAGTYNVCLTVAGEPAYQQCFTSVITEPNDLSVYSVVNKLTKQVTVSLAGADSYNVTLNGTTTTTTDSQITLALKDGVNELTVTTDKACQGSINSTISIGTSNVIYPNPFQNTVNVNIGDSNIKKTLIAVFDSNDKTIYSHEYDNQSGVISFDLPNLNYGVYFLRLTKDDKQAVYKLLKQ